MKVIDFLAPLKRKGFTRESGKKGHDTYQLVVDGFETRVSVGWSHSATELTAYDLECNRKRMHLDKDEFLRFLDCSLDKSGYAALMRRRGKAIAS